MKNIDYISIHHSSPDRTISVDRPDYLTFIRNLKIMRRKQLLKDVVFMILFGVVMMFRAYIFFKYGV